MAVLYTFQNFIKYMTQNLTKLKEGLLQILIILSQKLIEWMSRQNDSQGIDNLNTTNHLVLTDIYRMLYQMTTDYMFFHIYHNTWVNNFKMTEIIRIYPDTHTHIYHYAFSPGLSPPTWSIYCTTPKQRGGCRSILIE